MIGRAPDVGGSRRADNVRRKEARRHWEDRRRHRLDLAMLTRERQTREVAILLWLAEQRLALLQSVGAGPHGGRRRQTIPTRSHRNG